MKDLVVSGNLLEDLKLTPAELILDLAVYLYDKEKLTMGQAKKLAKLSQIEFQKELANRNINIKYNLDDLEKDLYNLRN